MYWRRVFPCVSKESWHKGSITLLICWCVCVCIIYVCIRRILQYRSVLVVWFWWAICNIRQQSLSAQLDRTSNNSKRKRPVSPNKSSRCSRIFSYLVENVEKWEVPRWKLWWSQLSYIDLWLFINYYYLYSRQTIASDTRHKPRRHQTSFADLEKRARGLEIVFVARNDCWCRTCPMTLRSNNSDTVHKLLQIWLHTRSDNLPYNVYQCVSRWITKT